MFRIVKSFSKSVSAHVILSLYIIVALFPAILIIINSFKSPEAISGLPLALPNESTFSLAGYRDLFASGDVISYFLNSLVITVFSVFFVLLMGAMAAFALSEYRFRGNRFWGLYLAIGIMIPIRLGTVSLVEMIAASGLANTPLALILVYVAQGIPLAVFILSEFMKQISDDLKDTSRLEGLSEFTIFSNLVMPMCRPAIATVALFTLLPIWNDLWFPLVLANSEGAATLTLGTQQFIGHELTNWNVVMAALTVAILPVLFLYLIFPKQLFGSITTGGAK